MSELKENDILFTICPVANASGIAYRLGLIQEEVAKAGANARLLQSLPQKYWNNHFTYENDRLFREGGNTPPLWAKSNGRELLLLGVVPLHQRQVLVVRKNDTGDNLSDYLGRKFAVPVHSNASIDFHKASAEQAYEIALNKIGAKISDVEIVPLISYDSYVDAKDTREDVFWEIRTELNALNSGKVDVIFVKLSLIGALLETGKYRILYDLYEDWNSNFPINNEVPDVLTVSRQLAEKKPEVVEAYVRAVVKAAYWAVDNKDAAEAFLAQQSYGNLEQYRKSFDSEHYKKLLPSLSDDSLELLKKREDFLYRYGYLEKHVNIYEFVEPYFLNKVLNEF